MIKRSALVPVGEVGKPHGLNGEMQMTVDADIPVESGTCLIFSIDGIYVPFFVDSCRQRTPASRLVKLCDVESADQASEFLGMTVYMTIEYVDSIADQTDEDGGEDEEEGMYADSLVDSDIVDTDGNKIGRITGINMNTANVLFEVLRPDGKMIYIPVAAEFVVGFDENKSELTLDLPQGLIDSQIG